MRYSVAHFLQHYNREQACVAISGFGQGPYAGLVAFPNVQQFNMSHDLNDDDPWAIMENQQNDPVNGTSFDVSIQH